MQIIRTLFWVFILVVLLVFTAFNWTPVEVKLWENMIVETKIPALVIISFLLGLVPAWMIHRGTKWRLNRRIGALENAARTNAANRPAPPAPPPANATAPEPTNPVDPVSSKS
ncbi:DUF1049 domain-containing protein [Erythrobacter sp. W53]|uniref:DUF1049 domain-containing protein n=1 Tax=Erythrobacteraceae TaxID=335929 RepID=UPI0036D34208